MNRIKEKRKQAGMNQTELASKIGVNRATLSKYENGQIDPTVSQLMKIADALNLPLFDLFFADSDDYEFIKMLGLTNPGKIKESLDAVKPLPDKYATLSRILNYAGYNLQLIHEDYCFTGADGAYTLTEKQVEELFSEIVKYADYLCSNLEKQETQKVFSSISHTKRTDAVQSGGGIVSTPDNKKPPEGHYSPSDGT